MKKYMLELFFDVQKAFDSASVNTAIACLSFLGLKGRILRFLECYPDSRTFSVKLGKALNTPRPLVMGLPQGSVLSNCRTDGACDPLNSAVPFYCVGHLLRERHLRFIVRTICPSNSKGAPVML